MYIGRLGSRWSPREPYRICQAEVTRGIKSSIRECPDLNPGVICARRSNWDFGLVLETAYTFVLERYLLRQPPDRADDDLHRRDLSEFRRRDSVYHQPHRSSL